LANHLPLFVVKSKEMASKYDTNPLDPDFPEKAKAAAEASTRVLNESDPVTRQFAEPSDDQTRRFASANTGPYTPPYTGQHLPVNSYAAVAASNDRSRKVDRVNLPENILIAAAYFPFSLGLVAGLLELLFVPKHEAKVRFHAAQGLAAHIGYLVISAVLGVLGNLAGPAATGAGIFQVAATVMFIIFVIKAWRGKPIHIQALDDLTNWLDDKISPKN
jgi:uncharacterized membrane protein